MPLPIWATAHTFYYLFEGRYMQELQHKDKILSLTCPNLIKYFTEQNKAFTDLSYYLQNQIKLLQ